MIPAMKGVLNGLRSEDLLKLNLWEGDKIFLKASSGKMLLSFTEIGL